MRKSFLSFPFLVFALMIVFSSCQKEGSEGPEGPEGPAGEKGPKGDTGVANVIYSAWLDVEFEAIVPTPGDTVGYQAGIESSKINLDMLTKGEIKVYINWNTAAEPFISPLPYIDGSFLITTDFLTGGIIITANANLSTRIFEGEKVFQFRYVLIPGGVLGVKPNNVNLNNYTDVKNYFKLN